MEGFKYAHCALFATLFCLQGFLRDRGRPAGRGRGGFAKPQIKNMMLVYVARLNSAVQIVFDSAMKAAEAAALTSLMRWVLKL